jgi:hypothetical protein
MNCHPSLRKGRPFRINCERRDCAGAINLREFPAVTAKRKSRLAGLLYSSILTPHSGTGTPTTSSPDAQ